jgi:3',5'-cyclic-AMP phosphodiesterase
MKHSSYFNILQITDTHFRQRVDGTIYGVQTQILFEKVFAQIKTEIADLKQKIDLILVTGDVSQDGSAESYRRFHEFIKSFAVPCYFLQGNHDYSDPMRLEFGVNRLAPCRVSADTMGKSPWKVILLNSSVEEQVGGHFGEEQINYLKQQLQQDSQSPTMVCFHHHPMLIDCDWLDQQVIDDADQLFAVLDQYTNVKLCIYGHVHQDRKTIRNQIPYYASPSTCAQFKPEVSDFALDERAPGYRWIRCYADGKFETEVRRLKS